ncbi:MULTISPECIES: hypothetical protein [Kitasatospora]|uniref:Uncharacterized protein n=2 Tax=Kitasatospora TaxID=2063 RepID=A0ABT1IVC9_9ACTN|nr:hypothetical protein [Kitasatospora paracochleata]MCP2309090.1 hypothetical protein [Kitasatospora paracochleata]
MSETVVEKPHPVPAKSRPLSGPAVATLGLALVAEALVSLSVLVSLWGPLTELTAQQGPRTADWWMLGLGPFRVNANTALLIVVVAASGLGSFVHAATSFASYAGKRSLVRSWVPWYLLRAGIGAALAVLVYFLLRGGLFANGTDGNATNPYGFAGIAGLCGLFSKQATDKLREVFDTILSTKDEAVEERQRQTGVTIPGPAAPVPAPTGSTPAVPPAA